MPCRPSQFVQRTMACVVFWGVDVLFVAKSCEWALFAIVVSVGRRSEGVALEAEQNGPERLVPRRY
jgi:hypothetical protein